MWLLLIKRKHQSQNYYSLNISFIFPTHYTKLKNTKKS